VINQGFSSVRQQIRTSFVRGFYRNFSPVLKFQTKVFINYSIFIIIILFLISFSPLNALFPIALNLIANTRTILTIYAVVTSRYSYDHDVSQYFNDPSDNVSNKKKRTVVFFKGAIPRKSV
jgi:hypothetical protein